MDDQLRHKLEAESAIAEEYKGAWERMVKPFFDKKKEELYEVFQACPVRDKDALVEIHAQHLALSSLEAEFVEHIQTGEMARQQLAEADKAEENNDE